MSVATALVKDDEGDFDRKQFKDLYQERVHKTIEAQVDNRAEMHPAAVSLRSGDPDRYGADWL